LAFGVGYLRQSVVEMMVAFASGVTTTMLVCVPPWPVYSRHPIAWQPSSAKLAEKKTQ
jgi:signal peptidase complex subunit 1